MNAVALRCQLRIEPHRRTYSEAETPLLADLFGTPDRWGDTLKPLQFAEVAVMVPGFTGATEIDLPVPCSYDLEVAANKYFASLEDGEIPLLLLFSGTVFVRTPTGFTVDQIPWTSEARRRVPVAVWREADGPLLPRLGLAAAAPRHPRRAAALQGGQGPARLGRRRRRPARTQAREVRP